MLEDSAEVNDEICDNEMSGEPVSAEYEKSKV